MVSYLVGRKYYPIPYNLRKIITLILVSIGIAYISMQVPFDNFIVRLTINTALLTAFLLMVYNMDTQVREVVLRYKKKLWK